ncbi:MAG TPA: hypothetical protein VF398_07700 [bacterium]|jgi:hypothetical protein
MRFLADFFLAVGDFIEAESRILQQQFRGLLVSSLILVAAVFFLLFGAMVLALGLFLLLAESIGYPQAALLVGGVVCFVAIVLIFVSKGISRS